MFSRVFISYRRRDFGGNANLIVGRIREHLIAYFGSEAPFLDTYSILAGGDFEDEIASALSTVSVVIAIIGPDWCEETEKRRGQVDYVLLELASALSLGVPIVPFVADGVEMPQPKLLTEDPALFARINPLPIGSGVVFDSNMMRLISRIDSLCENTEFRANGYRASISEDAPFGVKKFRIGNPRGMSFRETFELMATQTDFQRFLSRLLRESGFSSYILEMSPFRELDLDSLFEFVLLPIPLASGEPDRKVYEEYFSWPKAKSRGVVSFPNLGRNALLVVPAPAHESSDYKDLGSFMATAPAEQQDALWGELGVQILKHVSERAIWVSVAGGGIPWLHFRIDEIPKYYRYAPYRNLRRVSTR